MKKTLKKDSRDITSRIISLERELDDKDPTVRRKALLALCRLIKKGGIEMTSSGSRVNLHAHTNYSYNTFGYYPTGFAWKARKEGLAVAGIVDFDALHGVNEFLEAARLIGLKACASIESRVFVPEFKDKVINSPGEPGIMYHIGLGITRGISHPFLDRAQKLAKERILAMLERVNRYLYPVKLDYEKDVVALTPRGNVTERHVCQAYARKAEDVFPKEGERQDFWYNKLGSCPFLDSALQALIRTKTMKRGGVVKHPKISKSMFPTLREMNEFILECGGIPTLAWLDGMSDGERDVSVLIKMAVGNGISAINIIPDRNFTPGIKDQKLKNLWEIISAANKIGWPVIVGTEMNGSGQNFVSQFDSEELAPFIPTFLRGAYIAFAHSVWQRKYHMGYLSENGGSFSADNIRNPFYEQLGRELQPDE